MGVRFIVILFAMSLLGCGTLRAPFPRPDSTPVHLPESAGSEAERTEFEREVATCDGIASSLTTFSTMVQQRQADAAVPTIVLGASTTLVGAATGAISAYLAATATTSDSNTGPTAVVALVGSLVTAGLGIPTAIVGGRAGAQSGQSDAARTAAARIRELILQNYAEASQEPPQGQPRPSLRPRTAALRQQCAGQLNNPSMPSFESSLDGSESHEISGRDALLRFSQQLNQVRQQQRPQQNQQGQRE